MITSTRPCRPFSITMIRVMRAYGEPGVTYSFIGAPESLPFLRRRAILGHRGLHERLERALPGADNPVVRPDGSAHPLPLLGHLGIGWSMSCFGFCATVVS